jgi:hypothetical protein
MSLAITVAPSAANRRAVALPIPAPAPVLIAVLPFSVSTLLPLASQSSVCISDQTIARAELPHGRIARVRAAMLLSAAPRPLMPNLEAQHDGQRRIDCADFVSGQATHRRAEAFHRNRRRLLYQSTGVVTANLDDRSK